MIKPIHNDKDYSKTLARIDQLWGAKKGSAHGDELEILLALVESYDQKHYPIAPPSPIDAILFRMDQMGLTKSDLAGFLGSKSRVSEILSGKRQLTVRMMKILYNELGVPAESLLAE